MEKQELKESVLCNLRSVTQSCKGGVPLDRLERDYRDLLGTRIPYRDLGFSSLEGFVRSIPNVLRLKQGRDGSLMAEAVADSSTAHIASLISRQKQPKIVPRGSKRSHFSLRRGTFTSKYSSRGGRSSYGAFHSPPKPYGKTYKQDAKPSAMSHLKASPPNFKIKVDTIKTSIPKEDTTAPIAAPPKAKSRPTISVRGYEIAPRFQRLLQRKIEAEQQRSGTASPILSNESPIPTRDSPTPPRIPTPTQYSFSSFPSSVPSVTSAREDLSSAVSSRLASSGAGSTKTSSRFQEGNGFYSAQQRSPRPIRSRLTVVKASQQLDAAQSAKEYIEIYARMNNLTVDYSTKPIGQKIKNKGFVSILLLGENKYLSYPDVASTERQAEEFAAQNAVQKIKESEVLPETPISNPEDIQILLNRIEELVCEKPSGMFINGLQGEYEKEYKEQLPNCWIDLLKQSSVVDIDEIDVPYGKVPDGSNYIVRPTRGLSSGSTTPSETSGKLYPELQDSESYELIREDPVNDSHSPIPPLMIPPGNEWGVYVTDTSNCVAARLIDNDDEFLALSSMMSSYYNSNHLPVSEVFEGKLYTIIGDRIGGELLMHRVLANRILDDDMIECYYVDEGITDVVKKTDLQKLHKDFLNLPYQIVHFTLDGLVEYEPFMKPEHLEPLKFRTFIAVVKRWTQFDDFLPDDPAIHKIVYSVVLYDTSDAEMDICLNDTVRESVSKSLVCKLPKLNVSSQGYLTHVTNTGQIYLRFLHPENSWLEIELERLSSLFEEACLKTVDIPSGKVCVAKYEDEKWYRVVVPEHPSYPQSPDMIEVIFVDYGHPSIVKKSEVCDLQPFSELLSSLDYQAIKCELYNALPTPASKWTLAASQKLSELAPFNEELIIRVISEGQAGTLPKVNLHKRIYTTGDSLIISINENLANKPELFLDLSTVSNNDGPKVPSKLNLQHNTTHLLSKGSLMNYVPSVPSPIENSILSPFKNFDITSPVGIEWATTPDNVKSPEEEDLSPLPLSPPRVPEETKIFDVFVTIAATPHNFIVQPLETAAKMNDLMIQMQQFYTVEENLIEMHPSLLKKNSFYAALHSDNEWYRVRLVSFNTSEPIMAAVYYVDFGDFNTVRLQNLQKLYKQFRELPCQAIKASLAGVKPIQVDWNPVHCVKFKEMVTEKKFVAVVQKKCMTDGQDFSSLELELTLIDTTDPEKDVYIHELLIENSMALKSNF